jgi:hypothetical protein
MAGRKRSPPGESGLAKPTCRSSTNIIWERARLVDPGGQRQPDPMRGQSDGQHPRDRRRRRSRPSQRRSGVRARRHDALDCHSAWGPNADRRGNALNCLRKEGSNSEADSQCSAQREGAGASWAVSGSLSRKSHESNWIAAALGIRPLNENESVQSRLLELTTKAAEKTGCNRRGGPAPRPTRTRPASSNAVNDRVVFEPRIGRFPASKRR